MASRSTRHYARCWDANERMTPDELISFIESRMQRDPEPQLELAFVQEERELDKLCERTEYLIVHGRRSPPPQTYRTNIHVLLQDYLLEQLGFKRIIK